ncbi:hypothetical protein ABC628_09955 [Lentilactobacillus otakiensis]|uniref:Uncharacterized protein n=1 Tax=Lentilactobacillus otakiensis DSM 19908 = JCM 15040 TaxID=1423780 RepID=S4NER5_9LACO|nr:hypothetical protein [Lentilactobacillus otakiensis]KRL09321.1 hypothetical protein FD05_GL001418 [Lentilactobacillus otakiensis DSM 19908 = JCM 15040]MBZ3776626.1 hypothetical protein [Lentilactobacillus otakiensis]MDV3517539.1 hypothetical protein [Lentilactobacillus otakiensis]GAD15672.1 hypothetical protein LOT_0210 [Lentilactobacillus otakiensis DSM 19908 = JCM 15040]
MKKQTILYGLSLAALAASTYAAHKSNQNYEKYLAAIVKDTKESAPLKGFKYMGSWSVLPNPDSDVDVFHFGFNYLDQNGDNKIEEFWVNGTTKKILKHQLVSL